MDTLTPPASLPHDTSLAAAAGLKRLSELDARLKNELKQVPGCDAGLLDAITSKDIDAVKRETQILLERIDAFWTASTLLGEKRYSLFLSGMQQGLRDELALKRHERNIGPQYIDCLPPSPLPAGQTPKQAPTNFALHIQFQENLWVEIAGALAMQHQQGHILLVLPGVGAAGFADKASLQNALSQWLNEPLAQDALLNCIAQRSRDWLTAALDDHDTDVEPFTSSDLKLQPITGDAFTHALESLLGKQRDDVSHACASRNIVDPTQLQARIEQAMGMRGLLGPAAMLELRELAHLESRYRQSLPDWIKIASPEDLGACNERLIAYDQARTTMLSALGAAASPQDFAAAQLRVHLANDLGLAIDPHALKVSTRRTLAQTGESYTVSRSLVELALYGLHPGDRSAGSAFLEHTTLTLNDAVPGAAYAALTPEYLGQLIESLELRINFATFQRSAYGNAQNQQLMNTLTRRQIAALAFAAQLQGHISPADVIIVESCMAKKTEAGLRIQHLQLDSQYMMGRILIFVKSGLSGQPERLIMFAADKPNQCFKAFDTHTQLVHELTSWTASGELCDYLLRQAEIGTRKQLEHTLLGLRHKPYPPAGFVQRVDQPDIEAALQRISTEHIRVALSEHAAHTPPWFQRADLADRQQLLALEDAAIGALANYQAKPHTRVQPFKEYVHERASRQIGKLLNLPAGQVDPDLIIITTERETVSYTDMLLNGYDDSIDFTHSSADTQATFSGPPGVDLSALTPARVAGSVRGKWLGDDYIALIKGSLLAPSDTGYAWRRCASVAITQLQMLAAALRSLLKGHIDAGQYAWLKASIERANLDDPLNRERYALYPLQIHIDKPFIASGLTGVDQLVIPAPALTHIETVQGCLVVLPTEVRQAALLYTPQAPDGIEFRLFGDFVASLKGAGMIDYYKDRCRIKARRNLAFFLHDMAQGKANKPPVIPREAISDFASICFNRPLERALRDVSESTHSRNDMLARLVWTTVELAATLVTLPFPPASFAVGVMLAMHDAVRAFRALREGDSDMAAAHVLTSMLNSLGAAGDVQAGLKGFGGLLHRLDQPARSSPALRPLTRRSSLPRYEDLYPVDLENESYLLARPTLDGHAPVYRGSKPGSRQVESTGQFAIRSSNGKWQPLDQQPPTPLASGIPKDRSLSLSMQNVTPVAQGHAKGVNVVNGIYCIELSGKTWQVQYDAHLRCWQIIDPANPFAFFGKQPVRLDAEGKWQLLDRQQLRGGGIDGASGYTPLSEEGAGSVTATIAPYELPETMRPHLQVILTKEPYDPSGIGLAEYFETYFTQMRQTFSELREKLYRDAQAFFQAPVVPPRPTLPALSAGETMETLLPGLFNHANGIVLSEAPKSVASKRLLILSMPLLVEQRVDIIYIEHLFSDKHLQKLARYRQSGRKSRSGSHEIKYHLESLNDGALNNLTTEYDYYHLIKTAHRHGIEIRPLNSSVSYPLAQHPVASAANDATATRKMSLFFGHTLISGDVAAQPSRRWIALVDQDLATRLEHAPGLAELQGAISVRVRDVPASQPLRIKPGSGRQAAGASANCDVSIEFGNPLILADTAAQPPSALDSALLKQMNNTSAADAGELWAGEYGFRWDETQGWLRMEPEDWPASDPLTPIQRSLTDTSYEIPVEQRSAFHHLAHFENRGLDAAYSSENSASEALREQFFTLRSALQRDARKVISDPLPPRPALPEVAPQMASQDVLQQLYQQTDGLVIGESHSSIASKKFIIDHLPLLSRQQVKTVYMEHLLTDLHQADLDRFFETGQMSKTLLHDLKKLDRGHQTDPDNIYTFERLVIRAQQQGLEIRAIDCSASYYLKGIADQAPTTRQQMMNYFASRTINRHQQVMGAHKWIALVGNSHSNTFENLVPGIAELQGGIGLRVVGVEPGYARGIIADPGELLRAGITEQRVPVKGDYLVESEIPLRVTANRPPQPLSLDERLSRAGMFLIDSEGDLKTVVHRSRDGSIHRTKVQVDAAGKLYIDRPVWASVHLTPYESIDALTNALEALNLNRVA